MKTTSPKSVLSAPVCLGSDHAGFWLKEAIKEYLVKLGHDVIDFGAPDDSPSDYPDFVIPAAQAAVELKGRAIVFGGSGTGECIAANKVKGIRCALPYDAKTARLAREHNDANAIALGSRTVTGDVKLAKRLVKIWLDTPFSAEPRHVRRLKKIAIYEKKA
jgi:ribose 5-phosphate isomerase B